MYLCMYACSALTLVRIEQIRAIMIRTLCTIRRKNNTEDMTSVSPAEATMGEITSKNNIKKTDISS